MFGRATPDGGKVCGRWMRPSRPGRDDEITAVDTSVLLRIVVNDDPAQAARAVEFFRQQNRVFLAKTVLLEVDWVLRSAYRLERPNFLAVFRGIVSIGNIEIEDEGAVAQAMQWYEKGMDFDDGLHVASAGYERSFATFDAALQRTPRRLATCGIVVR